MTSLTKISCVSFGGGRFFGGLGLLSSSSSSSLGIAPVLPISAFCRTFVLYSCARSGPDSSPGVYGTLLMMRRPFSGGGGAGGGDILKPRKITNRKTRGIVPLGEDYGGYDEDKHEEYEEKAKRHQVRIRWLKKIFSAVVFSSIFGTVLWARNKKQRELEKNTKNVTFLPRDTLFTGSHDTFCILQNPDTQEKVVLPASIVQDGTIRFIQTEMQLRPGDVIVASFPKTGTTWVQEIVYLIKNNLDFDKAKASVLEDRFPFLEYPYPGVKSVDKMPTPRLIKTHLPYGFLPSKKEQAKIIYTVRNPKDTVVSYFHFARMLSFSGFTGTFDEYKRRFQASELPYCPFFDHIESFVNQKDNPNVLIVSYEELSSDPVSIIQKIADFLENPLTREEAIKIANHTRFKEMSVNPAVNYSHWDDLGIRNKNETPFLRKGQVGDWENYFAKNDTEFDKWIQDNNRFGFKFDYHSK